MRLSTNTSGDEMTASQVIILISGSCILFGVIFILFSIHRIQSLHKLNIQRIKEREAQKANENA